MSHQLSENGFDDMDRIMSQIDSSAFKSKRSNGAMEVMVEELDTIDMAMSQIDTELLYPEEVEELNDCDIYDEQNIPDVLMEKYEEAVNEVDEELVEKMQREPDVEFDPSQIPEELLAEYEKAVDGILPVRSTNRYIQAYNDFRKWQASYGIHSFNEKVIMAYFSVKSKMYKPPTLWSIYSMLKKTLICKHNIDLTKYCQLRAFLKTNADGYHGTKSKVFTPANLYKFFVEAPNTVYLGMKVRRTRISFTIRAYFW